MTDPTSSIDVIQWIAPLAAALVGSAIGGWFGAKKYRSERGFDLRVRWFETALEAVENSTTAAIQAQLAIEHHDDNEQAAISSLRATFEPLARVAARAPLYGTTPAVAALLKLTDRITKPEWALPSQSKTEPWVDELYDALDDAQAALTAEFRNFMGYERVGDGVLTPTGWSVTSSQLRTVLPPKRRE